MKKLIGKRRGSSVDKSKKKVVSGELTDKELQGVSGGEIKDFSFGVENPTTIGSATGGAGAVKIKFN